LDGLVVRAVAGWMLTVVVLRFLWLWTLGTVMRWSGVSLDELARNRAYLRCCFGCGRWLVDDELELLGYLLARAVLLGLLFPYRIAVVIVVA
jgi:hypothetical protein